MISEQHRCSGRGDDGVLSCMIEPVSRVHNIADLSLGSCVASETCRLCDLFAEALAGVSFSARQQFITLSAHALWYELMHGTAALLGYESAGNGSGDGLFKSSERNMNKVIAVAHARVSKAKNGKCTGRGGSSATRPRCTFLPHPAVPALYHSFHIIRNHTSRTARRWPAILNSETIRITQKGTGRCSRRPRYLWVLAWHVQIRHTNVCIGPVHAGERLLLCRLNQLDGYRSAVHSLP